MGAEDYLHTLRRRAAGRVRRWRGRSRTQNQTDDSNFIGFDKYSRHGAYHWDELEHSADYRQKAEFVQQFMATDSDVLDIGCGDGAYAYVMAPHCRSIVGIDADVEAIHLARRELTRHGVSNAEVHQMAISGLSLERLGRSRPFDVIYSMDVIEHLPDPAELGKKIVELSGPNSEVIIGTPKYLGDDLVSEYHVREFTADALGQVLSAFVDNFRIEEMPMRRTDGQLHPDGFLVLIGTPVSM